MPIYKINGKSQSDKRMLFEKLNSLRGADYMVEIKEIRPGRSDAQRRYYWSGIVTPLAEEFGYDKDAMHEILKYKFLAEGAYLPNGEFVIYPQSTTKNSTVDDMKYCESIRIWALTEFGINLLPPDEWQALNVSQEIAA